MSRSGTTLQLWTTTRRSPLFRRRATTRHDGSVQTWRPAVDTFASRLAGLGWVTHLWVAGSAATGDHREGVSDLDLVALVDGPVGDERRAALTRIHSDLDAGPAAGADLGCVHVEAARLPDVRAVHPTWTHGGWVERPLSLITRAELALHGIGVLGHPPQGVVPPVDADDVRAAARAEVTGYWTWAARRPWLWLDPVIADLGLTGMARARAEVATGTLLTKTEAIEQAAAPEWLKADLRARRHGAGRRSPRLRTAWTAWRDARRTVAELSG